MLHICIYTQIVDNDGDHANCCRSCAEVRSCGGRALGKAVGGGAGLADVAAEGEPVHDRLRSRLRSHCDEAHQPYAAKGRHTRYRDGVDDRERRFADDLLSVHAATGPWPQAQSALST
jgi:hypothetical protein